MIITNAQSCILFVTITACPLAIILALLGQ